jgi:hypothetical protein
MDEYKPLGGGGGVHEAIAVGRARPRHGPHEGRAMPIDPNKLKLKPPGTKRLKLNCDVLLSTSAFNFNLRRYMKVSQKKYNLAVITVLGKEADAVVVDDSKVAKECVQYLKVGRCWLTV